MASIQVYLIFNGNCRQAMEFYKNCFGGDLVFQTVGDTSRSDKMPLKMKNRILHSTLTAGNLVLMGSDLADGFSVIHGNSLAIAVACSSELEIRQCYQQLVAGGTAKQPLQTNHWGITMGELTDKYGNHWMLHFKPL